MSVKRIAMRKIREVLRLLLEADLSVCPLSICTKVSVDKKATSVAVNMVRESHN